MAKRITDERLTRIETRLPKDGSFRVEARAIQDLATEIRAAWQERDSWKEQAELDAERIARLEHALDHAIDQWRAHTKLDEEGDPIDPPELQVFMMCCDTLAGCEVD